MPQLKRLIAWQILLSVSLIFYIFCNLRVVPAFSQTSPVAHLESPSKAPEATPSHSLEGTGASSKLEDYMPRVSPAMLNYSHAKYAAYFLQSFLEMLAAFLFLRLGLAKALRDRAESLSGNLVGRLLIFVPIFYAFLFFANLPLRFYSSYWLEHSMHLSDQSLWSWFEERLKLFGLNLATELPLWMLLFGSIKRFPKAWPYLTFGLSLPLIWLAVFAAPIVFDPVFNDFTRMPKSPIRDQITALASRAGLTGASIYVSDHSKQSKKINAYVTGIGASARIVLWDTTLKTLPEDEILAIVAHELGHNVLNHINCGCVIAAIFSLCLLPFNIYCAPLVVRSLPENWQIRGLSDIEMVPVIVLASFVVTFLGDPIINSYSRRIEHEADAYGLELTKNGPAMARLFVALAEQNLSEPDPNEFIKVWYFSHPSLKERIEFALKPKGY